MPKDVLLVILGKIGRDKLPDDPAEAEADYRLALLRSPRIGLLTAVKIPIPATLNAVVEKYIPDPAERSTLLQIPLQRLEQIELARKWEKILRDVSFLPPEPRHRAVRWLLLGTD